LRKDELLLLLDAATGRREAETGAATCRMAAGMVRMFVILSKAKDLLLLLLLLFLSAIPRRESVANRFFPPINAGAPYLTAFFAERCGLFR